MKEMHHERIDRIGETGWQDMDDAVWLTGLYKELSKAVRKALFMECRVDGAVEGEKALSHYKLRTHPLTLVAMRQRLIPSWDYFHHAPRCGANTWSETTICSWHCSCGARQAGESGLRNGDPGYRLMERLTKKGITDPAERMEWLMGYHRKYNDNGEEVFD